jgi:hypothetical protein
LRREAELQDTPEQLDKCADFAERQLRYNLLSAAYGYRTATQVFNDCDPQIARAVDAMPRARELAQAASRARAAITDNAIRISSSSTTAPRVRGACGPPFKNNSTPPALSIKPTKPKRR